MHAREKRLRLLEQVLQRRQETERVSLDDIPPERILYLIALTLEVYKPGESSRRRALVKIFAEGVKRNGTPEQIAHWEQLHKEEEEAWARIPQGAGERNVA